MVLTYVTGISGSGKSAVCGQLRERGYEAYDADHDGQARWVDRRTGIPVGSYHADQHTPEWFARYDWHLDPEQVEALAERTRSRPVFLCGAVTNDKDVWPLFDRVVYLAIDEATIRHRLATRDGNPFGRAPHELDAVLRWWRSVGADDYRRYGAIVIDGTQALGRVVDEVLAAATQQP